MGNMKFFKNYAWYFVSLFLLAIYLIYFHLLNVADPQQVKYLGAGFGSAWLVSCFVFQSCFRNRFVFGIHALVTLDFVLEALAPVHSGFGFYFCAVGFWTVFVIYHHYPPRLPESESKIAKTGLPELAMGHQNEAAV